LASSPVSAARMLNASMLGDLLIFCLDGRGNSERV
jgi:hypothetical protein